jgi:hypothetical protein
MKYLAVLCLILLASSCDSPGSVNVDTSPVGVGLTAIAAALVLAAFIGGNDE